MSMSKHLPVIQNLFVTLERAAAERFSIKKYNYALFSLNHEKKASWGGSYPPKSSTKPAGHVSNNSIDIQSKQLE